MQCYLKWVMMIQIPSLDDPSKSLTAGFLLIVPASLGKGTFIWTTDVGNSYNKLTTVNKLLRKLF